MVDPRPDQDQRLLAVTDALPVLISYIDAQQRYTFVNSTYERWFARSRSEILGRSIVEVIGEPAYAEVRGRIEETLRGNQVQWESRFDYPGVGARHVSAVYVPDFGPGHEVRGIVALVTDITERKRIEESARASEAQLRVIFEGVADGILVQDREFRCVYANAAGARMCGFETSEAFRNASIPELLKRFELRDEDGNPFPREKLPAYQALMGEPAPLTAVIRVRNLESFQETWSEVSARPVLDASGKPHLAVSIFRDITAEKIEARRQAFLARATELLSSSLDYGETLRSVARISVPDLADWCTIDLVEEDGPQPVAVAYPEPAMLDMAQEYRRKFPQNWDAPTGAPNVLRTGKPELYPEITDAMLVASARNEEHLEIIRALGMKSVMIVPIQTATKVIGVLTLISTTPGRSYDRRDVDFAAELGRRAGIAVENARLYRSAQEAVRARDEFLSIASHELKTPLTSLKLQTQMNLRLYDRNDPKLLERESLGKLLRTTARQVERLSKLVDDMLDISRIAHGKLALEPTETDLGQLARELVDRFSAQLSASGCAVRLDAEPGAVGNWDRYRIEQVISNLLTNAMKYGAGKPVEIRVSTEGKRTALIVRDHGIGIASEDLARIFERFERAISSAHVSGLGLGLYISRQIVEAHGGSIRVESAVGEGSTFRVELPLS